MSVSEVVAADCSTAATGLAGWWPGDGNANDIAGGNNGLLQGGATATIPGLVGPAFSFNGTSAFVQVADSAVFHAANLTIEAWVKFNSLDSTANRPGQQFLVCKPNANTTLFDGFALNKDRLAGINPNGDILVFAVSSSTNPVYQKLYSQSLVSTGVWYHVAAVRGSNYLQLYLNGHLDAQTNVDFPQFYDTRPLCFGGTGIASWDGKLNGLLDEVSFYNRALSPDEIAAIYSAGAAGKCKGPKITLQPQSQTVVVGSNAVFTVTAAGAGTLNYQWQRYGTNLAEGGRMSGTTNATLTVYGVLGSDAGTYDVAVSDVTGVATSADATLSITPLLGWGYNYYGQSTAPAGATNIVAVGAGSQHALALRADGSLVTWGYDGFGLAQIPAEATNVVAMAVGDYHNLVLRADGTVVAWGNNDAGETNVPPEATNVVALAGGDNHSLALRADGTVVGWGDNLFNEVTIPAAATNVVAIGAGLQYSLALKADGSIVAWGIDQDGEIDVPAGATNVVAIAAGAAHSLALKADGTLLTWGNSFMGSTTIPPNLPPVTAISCGGWDSLALLQDGSATGWGYNYYGQASPPSSVTNPAAIYAGGAFSLAWLRDPSTGIRPGFWRQVPDQNLVGGQPIFLYPGVNGTLPLRFQWYFNNSPMPGQTNRWLSVPNANPTQSGGYFVVATNDFGAMTSQVSAVTVQPAIAMATQPTNITVRMNDSIMFAATVTGTAPLWYRWQKDGVDLADDSRITGSGTATLSIGQAQASDSGGYQLVVTNSYAAVTSAVATLTVLVPTPLLNVDFGAGSQSPKTGPAAIGESAGDFWNFYSVGSPGVSNLALADGALTGISIVVSNAPFYNSTGLSDPMLNNFIYLGQFGGSFTVSIFGLPPGTCDFYLYTPGAYYFPWYGADFELVVDGVSLGHSVATGFGQPVLPWEDGVYYGAFHNVPIGAPGQSITVVVRGNFNEDPNIAGMQIGQFLASNSPPVFWTQPANQFLPLGASLVLSATASGFPDPMRQWYFNGAPLTNGGSISGATGNTLTISNAQFADAGEYFSIISNSSGTVTSAVASVVVGIPPALALQPTNQTWITGSQVLLAASATGTDPLAYQWYRSGTPLVDDARLGGTTSDTLNISNVLTSDAGSYTLIVSNPFGSTTSSVALVIVVVPPAMSTQPRGYSVPVGMPVTLSAFATGTTPFGYQWRLNGADVPGATGNSLSFTALSLTNFGDYQLVVSNFGGAVTSSVASLTAGPVAIWGSYSQAASIPAWPGPGLSNVIALAAGSAYSLALRADGTLYAWGNNPATNLPAGLSGIVGIAGGISHALAVRSNGTVVGWGLGTSGQTNIPPNLSNVVAVAAGAAHSAALRADGTVVVWGSSVRENQTNVPPNLIKVNSIDAGGSQTLALRENGDGVGWGGSTPQPVPPYLHGITQISATSGSGWDLALLTNGTLAGWGALGMATNIPRGLTNLVAVEAVGSGNPELTSPPGVSLVIRSNGTVFGWGGYLPGSALTNIPPGLSNAVALAGGVSHALVLENDGRPLIVRPPVGGTFYSGADLVLKAKAIGNTPLSFQWFKDGDLIPSGTSASLVVAAAQSTEAGSYQLMVSNALGSAQSVAVPITIMDSQPFLLSQPGSCYAYFGSPFSVGASVAGSGPMQLTWFQNGVEVANSTNELAFNRALPQHGGAYQLIASNPFGSLTSAVAQVTFSRVASWGSGPALTNAPFALSSVQGVASGYFHALVIRSNATVAAWGTTLNGATNVPAGLSNVIAVSGGNYFSLALKSDGTVAAWGLGSSGQTTVPASLSNVVAVSAGGSHALALRANGTVAAWGANSSGQVAVPAGLSNVVAIAAGSAHSLALMNDGTIVGWGAYGKVPAYTNVVAVSAGFGQSLALQGDGTVVAWSTTGAATALPAGLSNVVAISAGGGYQAFFLCSALRADGTLISWGNNNSVGQWLVPAGLVSATAISVGGSSTLALLNDLSPAFTVQPWNRQVASGTNLTLTALAVGQPAIHLQWYHNGAPLPGATNTSLTLSNTHPSQSGVYQLLASNDYGTTASSEATLTVSVPAVSLKPLGVDVNGFRFSFTSLGGVLYIVEFKDDLAASSWMELERRFGVGGLEIVTDPSANGGTRFYRVRALYAPPPRVSALSWAGGSLGFSVPTVAGAIYVVQYKDRLEVPGWLELSRQTGTGASMIVNDPNPSGPSRFYRVKVE